MLLVEPFRIEKPISVLRAKALTFPEGILAAYEQLDKALPNYQLRTHFGISHPNQKGEIQYWAAMAVLDADSGNTFGQEPFEIVSGNYASILIVDFYKNMHLVKQAFKELTALPDIDPNGYCLEMMVSFTDVRCLVKLLS
jgi:hypothetical protein